MDDMRITEILTAAVSDGLLSEPASLSELFRGAGRQRRPLTPESLKATTAAYSAAALVSVSQLASAEILERFGDAPLNADLAEALAHTRSTLAFHSVRPSAALIFLLKYTMREHYN